MMPAVTSRRALVRPRSSVCRTPLSLSIQMVAAPDRIVPAMMPGTSGFGFLILTGMQRGFFTTEMIAGAVLSVTLAIVADALLVLLQRRLTPWTRAA